ncbi:MAG: hypothetical protein HYX69_08710 [Planctomycetia bacterium]|nr:hypothetical protein [Planctomycetia bacterium]
MLGHELAGHREATKVGRLSADRLIDLWPRTASQVVKYGFALELADLEPPRTGIFDGLRIVVDPDVNFEMQCFVLLHLFGHSVQWVAPSLAAQVDALQQTAERDRFMQVLHDYEHQAGQLGLQLLHEAGVGDLDGWFSDFVATDWRYVERFYATGQILPWEECLTAAEEAVRPLAIPALKHHRVEVRYAF